MIKQYNVLELTFSVSNTCYQLQYTLDFIDKAVDDVKGLDASTEKIKWLMKRVKKSFPFSSSRKIYCR